jgi:hypothetical protein
MLMTAMRPSSQSIRTCPLSGPWFLPRPLPSWGSSPRCLRLVWLRLQLGELLLPRLEDARRGFELFAEVVG